jgi:hypothetical protein
MGFGGMGQGGAGFNAAYGLVNVSAFPILDGASSCSSSTLTLHLHCLARCDPPQPHLTTIFRAVARWDINQWVQV